jgi:glycosyltransferase involved in cell wall biosynthesis
MTAAPASESAEVLFLGHALDRTGPPIYLRHLLRWLHANTDLRTAVAALEGGSLHDELAALGPVAVVGEPRPVRLPRGSGPATSLVRRARRRSFPPIDDRTALYVNTAWSVRALRYLPDHPGPVISHVHELEVGLDLHLPPADRDLLLGRTDHWIAASVAVADNLARRWRVPRGRIAVHHEMIDVHAIAAVEDDEVAALRRSVDAGPSTVLVGTAAVVNWRKAPDLFLELAARSLRSAGGADVRFAWLGVDPASAEVGDLRRAARRAGLADRVTFLAASDRPEAWMRAFDLFVLPAREDAFPLACLEAAAAGRPIVCFDAGGMPELVGSDAGIVVDFPDVEAMARAVVDLASDHDRRRSVGEVARRRVRERHDVSVAAPRLWADLQRWARP